MTGGWPRRIVRVTAVLVLVGLVVRDVVAAAVAIAAPPTADATVGVRYSPRHNLQFPVYGTLTNPSGLARAIDDDFQLLSKYFTHVHTHSSTYYGIDMAPIAARYGLKLYLGVMLQPGRWQRQDVQAAIRAIRHNSSAVEAVIIRHNAGDVDEGIIDDVLSTVQTIKKATRDVVASESVVFGVLHSQMLNGSDPSLRRLHEELDIFGFDLIVDSPYAEEHLNAEWSKLITNVAPNKRLLVETASRTGYHYLTEEAADPSAVAYYEMFAKWSPIGVKRMQKFWAVAFDPPSSNPERLDFYPLHFTFGFFTYDKKRKTLGFPHPLRVDDDPIQPRQEPITLPLCPRGRYFSELEASKRLSILCMIGGNDFEHPTKFDEQSIVAVCQNPACWQIVEALRTAVTAPPDPQCPFQEPMSAMRIKNWILDPFDQYCHHRPEDPPLQGIMRMIPGLCNFRQSYTSLTVMWDEKEEKDVCEVLSGFSTADLQPLTEDMLLKMCFQPSCELTLRQLVMVVFGPPSPDECSVANLRGREWLESKILIPYYDGCYEKSSFASDYYDTTYRRRRKQPRLPLPGDDDVIDVPTPTAPIVPSPRPGPSSFSPSPAMDDDDDDDDIDLGSASAEDELDFSRSPSSPSGKRRKVTRPLPSGESIDAASGSDDFIVGNTTSESNAKRRWTDRSSGPTTSSSKPTRNRPSVTDEAPTHVESIVQPSSSENQGVTSSRPRVFVYAVGFAVLAAIFALGIGILWRRRHRRHQATETAYEAASETPLSSSGGHAWDDAGAKPLWADSALMSVFIPPAHIRDLRLIGSGGQALVYLVKYARHHRVEGDDGQQARWLPTGKTFLLASKRLPKNRATEPHLLADFVAEIKLIAPLRHPNIVRLVGATWTTGADLQALFEFMPGGDLCAYLHANPRADWTQAKLQLAINVIDALAYVHGLDPPLVHRDVKSRNVLLGLAAPSRERVAKLTDFGVSRRQSASATMTTGVGTSRWLAPEVILGGGHYDQSCDVYAFGVLLSELDTHALPFVERRTPTGDLLPDIALLQMIAIEGLTPAFTGSSPQELVALAQGCLAYDPAARPTARDVATRLRAMLSSVVA